MSKETKLLPCPWCGAKPSVGYADDIGMWYVECPNGHGCQAEPAVYATSKETAIAGWDRRKPIVGVDSDINAIREAYCAAKEEHPLFAHRMRKYRTGYKQILKGLRSVIEGTIECDNVAAEDILLRELAEAMEAHQSGNVTATLAKLEQCGAVILRMIEMARDKAYYINEDTL